MVRIGLILLLVVPAAHGQALRFADHTLAARMVVGASPVHGIGRGLAVTDYDGDGDDDVFVAMQWVPSRLFANDGSGRFTDVTGAAGIEVSGRYTAPVWADFDNDGHRDLLVGGYDHPLRLFRNRGDGTFAAAEAGSGLESRLDVGALALADFDGDGLVDVYVAVDRASDRLYRNIGGFRFEDVTTAAAVEGISYSVAMQASWADYDHDGDPDLFVVHDGEGRMSDGSINPTAANRFHRNLGYLPLIDQARTVGVRDPGAGNSMGIAWADFDGDGWEDAYVSRKDEGGLYRNLGDGTFEIVPGAAGAERNGMAWGTIFGDFDNDGDADLYAVNAFGYYGMPSLLYENTGGSFVDVSSGSGADQRHEAIGLASGDFDGDGVLDMVFSAYDGYVHLLRGEPSYPGRAIRVKLTGVQANRMAIGARVEVRAGTRTWSQFVSAGDSYCSQSSAVLHFGIGLLDRVDEVRVYWGGAYLDVVKDVAAGRTLEIEQSGATALPRERDAAAVYSAGLGVPFPNPAGTSVTVPFTASSAAWVRMEIVDALGRVRSVRSAAAETASVPFDTRSLAPGLYWIRLHAGPVVSTRPLVVHR